MARMLVLFIALIGCQAMAQPLLPPMAPDSLPPYAFQDIAANNVRMWVVSDGRLSNDRQMFIAGFEWPVNSGLQVLYAQGLVVSARDAATGIWHLFGSTYETSLQPGPILANGNAGDPFDEHYRVYRARAMGRTEFQLLASSDQVQLREDFQEWPVELGAPWTDGDGDNAYRPDFEAFLDGSPTADAPLLPGKEVLWFVSNNLDSTRCAKFFDEVPLAIEIQTLVWASPGDTVVNNTVFSKQTVINRSTVLFDSVYLGRWSDPDIGFWMSDRVGIDTALAMAYAYEGYVRDDRYRFPPAVGEVWLQTPAIPSPGDMARVNFALRPDLRNLPLHAFVFFTKDNPNPYFGPHGDDGSMMKASLRGLYYKGASMVDPLTGDTTTFAFAGDPVRDTGWHDAVTLPNPYERYMLSSVGPFTFAPGDTQEVVIATTVGHGTTHLTSITELRRNAHLLRTLYPGTLGTARIVASSHVLQYPDTASIDLAVTADVEGAATVHAFLKTLNQSVLARFPLHDDGAHNDGAANDGRYGGTLQHATFPVGADLCIEAAPVDGQPSIALSDYALPLTGPISLRQSGILSDHMNFDHHANPGEHCRVDVDLKNRTRFSLGAFRVEYMDGPERIEYAELDSLLASGTSAALSSGEQFLTVSIPESALPGRRVLLPLRIVGDQYCIWRDTISVEVEAFVAASEGGRMEHFVGLATGTLGWQHIAGTELKPHLYVITAEGEDWEEPTLTVADRTEGGVLATSISLPDRYGHDGPEFNGWKLSLGNALYDQLYTKYHFGSPGAYLNEEKFPGHVWSASDRAWLTFFDDEVGYMEGVFGQNLPGLPVFETYPVALVFDRQGAQRANGYKRGTRPDNYSYFGNYPIVVRAYDMRDSSAPRQLTTGFIEQQGSAAEDSSWMPSYSFTDREMLLISDHSYSAMNDALWSLPLHEQHEGKQYMFAAFAIRDSGAADFIDGDTLWILPGVPISRRDIYILDLTGPTAVEPSAALPNTVVLDQNYPNPVHPATMIRYSLPRALQATLTVTDAYGREVRRLVDGAIRNAGTHTVSFDATGLPSGVYFYRLSAGDQVQTRRMMVLR